MFSEISFRMLLFTTIYAFCIFFGTCRSIYPESDVAGRNREEISSSIYNFTRRVGSTNDHIGESEESAKQATKTLSEGGLTLDVNTSPVLKESSQDISVNEKIAPHQSVFEPKDNVSLDIKPHKGRKGVSLANENVPEISSETNNDLNVSDDLKALVNVNEASLHNKPVLPLPTTAIPATSVTINKINSNINTSTQLSNISIISMNKNVSNNHESTLVTLGTSNNNESSLISKITPSTKHKPGYTRDNQEADSLSSYTVKDSETDYVIPIVAIIFSISLIIFLGMILYKKSKEFWERRHYRRMDFLIDGMYND